MQYEFTKGRVYLIKWWDHWGFHNTWTASSEQESDLRPMDITSIGLCIGVSETVVRLASTMDQNGSFGGDITIMRNAIQEAWELEGAL